MGNWYDEHVAVCQEIVNNPRLAQVMNDSKQMEHILTDSGRLADIAASALRSEGDFLGAQKMEEAAKKFGQMGSAIGNGAGYITKATAVFGVYDAWMNIDPASVRKNPRGYTREFGRLFKHAGGLASILPPPLNSFEDFFDRCEGFFGDLTATITHQNPDSPAAAFEKEVFPDLYFYVDK
jgi:hypothetical protein